MLKWTNSCRSLGPKQHAQTDHFNLTKHSHQHTVHPEPDAWLAANAVTDGQIEALCREAWEHSPLGAWQTTGIPMRYGTGIDWDEFHAPTEYHGTPDCPTTGHTFWPITQFPVETFWSFTPL